MLHYRTRTAMLSLENLESRLLPVLGVAASAPGAMPTALRRHVDAFRDSVNSTLV